MFSAFGPLRRKPVVRKRLALKGQAWIIFEKQEDAQRAIAALQGTRIWGKSVVIRFARFRSDAVVREEGGEAAVEAEKRAREQDKSKREREIGRCLKILIFNCFFMFVLTFIFSFHFHFQSFFITFTFTFTFNPLFPVERAKNPRITKRQQLAQLMNAANPSAALQNVSFAGPDVLLPNKILFVQNVPIGYALAALKDQFKRFPGLVEVRGVPNRPDLAFVEFETEAGAGAARQIVDRQELVPGQPPVRVSFARK